MSTFDSETVIQLANKLTALDLTADEQAALDCILDRAADDDDEVAGFEFPKHATGKVQRPTEAGHKVRQDAVQLPESLMGLRGGGIKVALALGFSV